MKIRVNFDIVYEDTDNKKEVEYLLQDIEASILEEYCAPERDGIPCKTLADFDIKLMEG